MKPLLKWIGGKQKLLDSISPHFPKKINNYHELFVGGGSVLLKLFAVTSTKIVAKTEIPTNTIGNIIHNS